ncbi:MAG: IS4/IS5 family transposase, partial [Mesorhizobium sp.]
MVAAGGDFIVRTGWNSVRLTTPEGQRVDWNAIFESLQPGEICEMSVLLEHSGRTGKGRGKPLLPARLIVKRKDEEATQKAQKAARRGNQRRGSKRLHPMTLTAAG